MDAKDLIQQIKEVDAEILAMKQAHDYGLGRVNLETYEFKQSFDDSYANKSLILTVHFLNAVSQPMIQYFDKGSTSSFFIVSYNDGEMTLQYDLPNWTGFSLTVNPVFSATAIITDIDWSIS